MMKGPLVAVQQPQHLAEENMSNLTSASNEASASSVSRNDNGESIIYPQQRYSFAAQNQSQVTQPQSAKKKRNLPGNPDPDAEVIALSPKTLLATNRFVCEICNKGFQRDQNLQLHRRGHNMPWKLKQRTNKEAIRKKVYLCPEASCVHHDPSRALGDLTGIKKHFCRKHGEKKWKCDKCSKRYAVQSDWKAHSKTCGTREYRCDCGTLFSRRDSFITHRAFCDALAEETARGIPPGNQLLTSRATAASSSVSFSNGNDIIPLQPHQFSTHEVPPYLLSPKKDPHSNFYPRPEIPPWLACFPVAAAAGPGPPIFHQPSIRLNQPLSETHHHHQELSSLDHEKNPNPSSILGPSLPPFHPTNSPHVSATALLQKAAQMGAAMSSSTNQATVQAMMGPNQGHHVSDSGRGLNLSSRDQELVIGLAALGGNKAADSAGSTGGPPPPPPSLFQDMMMSSLSSAATTIGFEGSSFEDSLGGIFVNSKKDPNFDPNSYKTSSISFTRTNDEVNGGGIRANANDDMTRDFLGLRPLSQSEIFSIASLSTCMRGAVSSIEHQSNGQKSWQG